MDKKLIYIPSLNTGPLSSSLRKNALFNGKSFRWYNGEAPETYNVKAYLMSAGTEYKDKNYAKKFEFPDDMIIFGDSGGYQITTGVLKYSPEKCREIFNWLENNSTVAANLDIPPRGIMSGKYNECLTLSLNNFKYFYENQSGKTQFLNCLQGSTLNKYEHWYKNVNQFQFNGWAIGAPHGSYGVLASTSVLLEHKELLKNNVKIIHYFGASDITQLIIMAYLQKLINNNNLNVQVTSDSSSPGLSSKFGLYYTGYDIQRAAFNTIHLPRLTDDSTVYNGWSMPYLNKWDEYFFENGWIDVSMFKTPDYSAMTLHNMSIYTDLLIYINNVIQLDEYFYKDLFGINIAKLLTATKKIFESQFPINEFKKHIPLLKGKFKHGNRTDYEHTHEFF